MPKSIQQLQKYSSHLNVLYVEDEMNVAKKTQQFLQRLFNNVDLAHNGVEGLNLYKRKQHDIVISDISMPEMDGVQMSKEILAINEEQHIIITSAQNDAHQLISLINLGVFTFLTKPLDSTNFFKALWKVTRSIHLQNNQEKMQKMLEVKVEELRKILNLTDHAIAIVENGKIVKGNILFLSLLNISENSELLEIENPLISQLLHSTDSLYVQTMDELLTKLKQMESANISLQIGRFEKQCKVNLIHLSASRECLMIKALDVLKDEYTIDVLTGLHNKNYLFNQITQHIDAKSEFKVSTFKISNYGAIRKWSGPEMSLRAERTLAKAIITQLETFEFTFFPTFTHFQENGFVVLYNAHDKIAIDTILLNKCNNIPLKITHNSAQALTEIGAIKIEKDDIEIEKYTLENLVIAIGASLAIM